MFCCERESSELTKTLDVPEKPGRFSAESPFHKISTTREHRDNTTHGTGHVRRCAHDNVFPMGKRWFVLKLQLRLHENFRVGLRNFDAPSRSDLLERNEIWRVHTDERDCPDKFFSLLWRSILFRSTIFICRTCMRKRLWPQVFLKRSWISHRILNIKWVFPFRLTSLILCDQKSFP